MKIACCVIDDVICIASRVSPDRRGTALVLPPDAGHNCRIVVFSRLVDMIGI